MSKYPAATKNDHHDFCATEEWELVRGAKGKPIAHHVTFKLVLPNGDVLRTRISRPIDGKPYGGNIVSHILRDQLCVSKAEFWSCVKGGIRPDRGDKKRVLPKSAMPLNLMMELTRLGVSSETIQSLNAVSAVELLAELYQQDESR